jgi:hypothetical protein
MAWSLSNILEDGQLGTGALGLLEILNLVLGSGLLIMGAVLLGSRSYSAWYKRRWEKRKLRREEGPNQRG